MRSRFTRIAFAVAAVGLAAQLAAGAPAKTAVKKKQEAVASIEKHQAEIIVLSERWRGCPASCCRRSRSPSSWPNRPAG